MNVDLRPGDNRGQLRLMAARGEFVHSVVCDPPYGLVSVTKRFGSPTAAPAKHGTDGLFARQSRGFMGRLWDGTGIERDPEFWRLVYDVMLPGAYIIAFSSSRTYGYMQVAMEAAGFITHPMFGWVFGSGFPKGHDVARQIDKTLGRDGSLGGPRTAAHAGWIERGAMRGDDGNEGWQRPWMQDEEAVDRNAREYLPGSEEGQTWKGWKTGTQSLKPALEPIYFGQKPFSEKTGALNILKHGVGAVNIDACRVTGEPSPSAAMRQAIREGRAMAPGRPGEYKHTLEDRTTPERFMEERAGEQLGRYPANLVHDGSPEVVALFPNSKGQIADASTSSSPRSSGRVYGQMTRGNGRDGEATADKRYTDEGSTNFAMLPGARRNDDGSAARFFNSFPPIVYCPKAGKKDRACSKHATVKPVSLMEHYVKLTTPPGGVVLDPFAGSGTTGQACVNLGFDCILMEREHEYVLDIARRFDVDSGLAARLWALGEVL